jgi:hypothetical protein
MFEQIHKALDELKDIGVFDSSAERAEKTMNALMYLNEGVIKIEGIWYSGSEGAESAISHDMGAFPTGTAYVMNTTANGTTFTLYNGTAVIVSLATSNSTPAKYIDLQAGEQIFIPSNQTLADQQNLTSSIVTFNVTNAAKTTHGAGGLGAGVMDGIIGGIIVLIIYALVRISKRGHAGGNSKGIPQKGRKA